MTTETLQRKVDRLELRIRPSSFTDFLAGMSRQEIADMVLVVKSYGIRRGDSIGRMALNVDSETLKDAARQFLEGYRRTGRDSYLRAALPAVYDCPHCGATVTVDVDAVMGTGLYPACGCKGGQS